MLKVQIAGYNVDANQLDKTRLATPETIAAAYARISRSSKSIEVLRQEAALHVDKARASNQNIVFDMGHASIAEHAVFNLDIVGVSRQLTEIIQRSRLASFTEKSQRYVTFKNDYVIPIELQGTDLENDYVNICDAMFCEYKKVFEVLKSKLAERNPQLSTIGINTMAKEDARYLLPLATKTQMGMTINVRNLEKLLVRLHTFASAEALDLHKQIYTAVQGVAPSLIRYVHTSIYRQDCHLSHPLTFSENTSELSLLAYDTHADDKILAGLIFAANDADYAHVYQYVKSLDTPKKQALFTCLFAHMESFDTAPRAFELANFEFSLPMSACCYGQFKRHRMATIIKAKYADDYKLPPHVLEFADLSSIHALLARVNNFRCKLHAASPNVADYLVSNAHLCRVYLQTNLRELYHFVRLRSDKHAQWEIRALSDGMLDLIKLHSPLACQVLCGKKCSSSA